MDVAVATLDRGVRVLFTPSAGFTCSSPHPLCECILLEAPPPDWRYLHRYPVLKRHVLRQYRSVAIEMEKTPQTPRKRKKRSILQQSSDIGEYKALCLASLCQILAQCELLDDVELVETLVNLESLEVLRRVIGKRLLPLRLRMLLLGFALQSQQEKCLEAAVQSWIQQVCEKLLEEVLEATATRGLSEPLAKRTRTRKSDMKVVEGEQDKEKCCGFCRDGAISAEALRSNFGGWEFLVECTRQIAQVLEKAGESYATNHAMVALSAFWESLPVAGLTASKKTDRRRKRSEISVTIEEDVELSMSIAAYEKICRIAVGSSAGKADAFRIMWTSVWDREFKYMAQMKHITLADTVRHCSTVDAFASMALLTEAKKPVTYLPGFCAVMEVINSLFAGVSEIITAFAHVWGSIGSGAFPHVTISTRMGLSSTKRILRSYLSEILKFPNARHAVTPPSVNKAPASKRVSPLKLLFFLYEILSPVPGEQQDGSCFGYWDALMTPINSDFLIKGSAQDGIAWCCFLEKCVLGVGAEATMTMRCGNGNFLRELQKYCHIIMYGIVVTGGEVISSGGTIRRLLISGESDRSAVCQVLVQMMTTFGEDWITGLIAQLLRAHTSLYSTGEFNLQGVQTLFFPALVSYMKSSNRTNLRRRKTRQQQFTAFVHSVNVILNESEPTPLYLVSLIRFCDAWDKYQSSHTKKAPTIANRWGFRAMLELDVLPGLIECYSRDEVIHQEPSKALMFAAEVLQNIPNCPQTLEASLFKILSAVKAGAEQGKSITSNVLAGIDQALVSHSSDVLQRLLHAVRFAGVTQTRQLMSQIKDTVGTLVELRQQLNRWFSFVKTNGAAFADKESRLELSLLCTRLIRWFPPEFGNMQLLVMTPLDPHLVFALKAFVKEAGRPSDKASQSVSSSTARSTLQLAVRVEMALHSYLSAAALPDLETLTVLLTKAIVKCRSPDAFDHLTKVAEKNGRMLLPETAVVTLSSPLRGLEFLLTQQDEDGDDDEHNKSYARHAKSIIYQANTLTLLTVSASVFAGGLSWSTILFNEQSAVIWLPHFFEYVLKTDFCQGTFRVDMLLKCLDNLIRTADSGSTALQEAYWLAALLNTALIACSSRSAGPCADLEEGIPNRLRQIIEKMMQLLSLPFDTTMTQMICDEDVATVQLVGILSLRNSSKFARLVIQEDTAGWSCERFVGEKASGALRMIVSAAWNADTKSSQATVMKPSMQLFMPFSQWLLGALVYSQSFMEDPSRRWERTFASYVTDLYLHLEFEDVTCNLLRAWLTTWVTSNISRVQDEIQLLALLPSQVTLFCRLGLTPYRGSSYGQIQDSTSIWQLVFVTVNLAVDTSENLVAVEQATKLVVSVLTTLDLVELSLSSDFVPFSHVQDIEPFFQELEKFLSRLEPRVCGVAQVCYLLQYPLELLVCCYACKIPAYLVAESQLFLQRVDNVLRENFDVSYTKEFRDDTKKFTLQTLSRAKNQDSVENTLYHPQFAVDSTKIEAFFWYWKDEMLFKYDYLDRERCAAILKVIQAAILHSTK